jgi:methionyl-tRNA synthetase
MMQKQINFSRPFCNGTCPKCGNEEAYGDQCEKKCGSTLNATDLINPKSTITGETPIMKSTKHWFCLWIVMKNS